jgi:hypothetical protein
VYVKKKIALIFRATSYGNATKMKTNTRERKELGLEYESIFHI